MSPKKKAIKPEEVLHDIKKAVNTMKNDTSSKDILNFLREESPKQTESDTAFF